MLLLITLDLAAYIGSARRWAGAPPRCALQPRRGRMMANAPHSAMCRCQSPLSRRRGRRSPINVAPNPANHISICPASCAAARPVALENVVPADLYIRYVVSIKHQPERLTGYIAQELERTQVERTQALRSPAVSDTLSGSAACCAAIIIHTAVTARWVHTCRAADLRLPLQPGRYARTL